MSLNASLYSNNEMSFADKTRLNETLTSTSKDLFKTTTGTNYQPLDSGYYQPPVPKSAELAHLKQSMHFIPYESEPHYKNNIDLSPMHLSDIRKPLQSPYKNYMYSTTTGVTHSEYSAQQNPSYGNLAFTRPPFNPKMSFIGNYQQDEEHKYVNENNYNYDAPTETTLYVNPTRKYVSETRDKFSAPPHPENVADTWNENVDKLKDMYIKMDRTAKKPFITAGVPLTSTYNAIHSPDNTYLRTDKMEEKETQEMLQYSFRDAQGRGKNKGHNTSYSPKRLPMQKLEPLKKDVYVQQFPAITHSGLTSTIRDTHIDPDVSHSALTQSSRSINTYKADRNLGKFSTTMTDSFKPHTELDPQKDYFRAELRKPQILKKSRLEQSVNILKKYDGAGIAQQPMLADPRHTFSKTKPEYNSRRTTKEEGREDYTEMLKNHMHPPTQRHGDKLSDPSATFFKTTNEAKNHLMMQLSSHHDFD